jgi:hypothetical protein
MQSHFSRCARRDRADARDYGTICNGMGFSAEQRKKIPHG